jgi:ankyrin repeat protein
VHGGNERLIKFLLSKGLRPTIRSSAGLLPIHTAVLCGHTKVVELLLNSKLKPEYNSELFLYDKIMLHWAAEQGNSDIVSLLLKAGFDPAALNLNEKNVAEVAALNGHRELSEFIEKRINNKLS